MRTWKLYSVLLIALGGLACTSHIAPYRPKVRRFDPGTYDASIQPRNGSMFREGSGGLFEDIRARGVGDIVVIKIDEFESATRGSSTKVDRSSKTAAGLSSSFGLLSALPADVSAASLLGADSSNSFEGGGKVDRNGRLVATLPVRVRRVLPNGDLYVEGTKVILVNDEEHHLYISGIVRGADIGPDDVVPSSRVADAEIEYTGRGVMSDAQRQGWLSRLFNKIWPF